MQTQPSPTAARLALLGIAMPIWFLGLATVLGATRLEYDPLRDAISELGAKGAPNPFLWQIAGFGVGACLELGYAFALHAVFGSRALVVLTSLVAVTLLIAAGAPCDAGCPAVPTSPTMVVHTIAGLTTFALLTMIPFAGWLAFRRHARWQAFAFPSLLVGATLVVLFLVGPVLGPEHVGAWQRTFLLIYFGWQGAIAWRLNRRVGARSAPI